MEKYYIPELEEFHVGFEIELYSVEEGCWGKYILKDTDKPSDFLNDINFDNCRVKNLNQEDIESLGWEVLQQEENWVIKFKHFEKKTSKNTFLEFYSDSNVVVINNGEWYEDNITWFSGVIKNKSELKKLIKQINSGR